MIDNVVNMTVKQFTESAKYKMYKMLLESETKYGMSIALSNQLVAEDEKEYLEHRVQECFNHEIHHILDIPDEKAMDLFEIKIKYFDEK